MVTPPASWAPRFRLSSARLAWSLWLLAVGCVVAGAMVWLTDDVSSGIGSVAIIPVAAVTLPLVGAVIASRRPGNVLGWLYLGLGLNWSLVILTAALSELATSDVVSNWGTWMIWLVSWLWVPALIGTFALPLLLYPDGQLISRRWRWALGIVLSTILAVSVGTAFANELIQDEPPVMNPVYVAVPDSLELLAVFIGIPVFFIVLLAPLAAVLVRFRRSRGVERQQLKVFVWAAFTFIFVPIGISLAGSLVGVSEGLITDLAWNIAPFGAVVGLPAAIAVAILRYRLYDIDQIINRTIVYGLLTAGVVVTYAAGVVVFQRVLEPLTRGSDLAVAGSTLAVAALIRPARGRIQRAVDRRFYRHKYDAARTINTFSTRLRDEIDLDTLTQELHDVVNQTMQPVHISIWVRERPTVETRAANQG